MNGAVFKNDYPLPDRVGVAPMSGGGPDWPMPVTVKDASWLLLSAERNASVNVIVRTGWSFPSAGSGFYSLWASPDFGNTVVLLSLVGEQATTPANFVTLTGTVPAGWCVGVGVWFEAEGVDWTSPQSIMRVSATLL